jgi:hypothetical protein
LHPEEIQIDSPPNLLSTNPDEIPNDLLPNLVFIQPLRPHLVDKLQEIQNQFISSIPSPGWRNLEDYWYILCCWYTSTRSRTSCWDAVRNWIGPSLTPGTCALGGYALSDGWSCGCCRAARSTRCCGTTGCCPDRRAASADPTST